MHVVSSLAVAGVAFGNRAVGVVQRPYETYRKLAERGTWWELVYIGSLLVAYFALAALVRVDAFRPFLLTKQFVLLSAGSAFTYVLVTLSLWLLGRIMGGRGYLRSVAVCWAYTLLPTVLWFLSTSVLYVVLPPPRLDSLKGNVFSLLYLIFSSTLFFWKLVLYYLTLRFALRLDLKKIVMVTICVMPLFVLYSIWMYRLGIFRIPFI